MSSSPSPPQGLSTQNPFPDDCAARYTPIKLIGEGGFGLVYLATQAALGRPVAVKLLLSGVLETEQHRARFVSEARITAAIRHPGVVTVVDHGAARGVPWIAYEYLPGASLRELCGQSGMAPAAAVEVVRQVALAVQAAHDAGVLHRDLKPENILEAESGRFKVTDFGIAKWTGDGTVKTATGTVVGTPAYLAPELILGEPPSAGSDIYALGTVLFELLTGRTPFVAAGLLQVLELHLSGKVPTPSEARPGLSPELDEIVLKALARRPELRHASAGELAARLGELNVAEAKAPPKVRRSATLRTVSARVARPAAAPPTGSRLPHLSGALLILTMAVAAWRWWPAAPGVPPRAAATPSVSAGLPDGTRVSEILGRIRAIRDEVTRMNGAVVEWNRQGLAELFHAINVKRMKELRQLTEKLCGRGEVSISRANWLVLQDDVVNAVRMQFCGLDGLAAGFFVGKAPDAGKVALEPALSEAAKEICTIAQSISRVDTNDPVCRYLRSSISIHLRYWDRRSKRTLEPDAVGYLRQSRDKEEDREWFVQEITGNARVLMTSALSGRDWQELYPAFHEDLLGAIYWKQRFRTREVEDCLLLAKGLSQLMALGDWKALLSRGEFHAWNWLACCGPILDENSGDAVSALLPTMEKLLSILPESLPPSATADARKRCLALIDGLLKAPRSTLLTASIRQRLALLRAGVEGARDSAPSKGEVIGSGALDGEVSSLVERYRARKLRYSERGATYAAEMLTGENLPALTADLDAASADLRRLERFVAPQLKPGVLQRRSRITALCFRAALWIELQVASNLRHAAQQDQLAVGAAQVSTDGIVFVSEYYQELENGLKLAMGPTPEPGLSIARMLGELKDLLSLFTSFASVDQTARRAYGRPLMALKEHLGQDNGESGKSLAAVIDGFWAFSARGMKSRDVNQLGRQSADRIRTLGTLVPYDRANLEAFASEIESNTNAGSSTRRESRAVVPPPTPAASPSPGASR